MVNRTSEVARLLGVELDEVFFVKEYQDYPKYPKTYLKFTESGLMNSVDLISWTKTTSWMWEQLITGALKINKLSWKPTKYDSYYFSCLDYEDLWGYSTWEDTQDDKNRLKHGIIFKTKEEAIDLAQRMLAVVKEAREDG